MMKLAWLTDIHLNFLDNSQRMAFYQSLPHDKDAIVISGDIAEANSVAVILEEMADYIKQPIYFVLGNHDYYGNRVAAVRKFITALSERHPLLSWLPACEFVILSNDTILVGQDGWADGRYGNYQQSPVELNDSHLIADLFQEKILGKNQLRLKMQTLADEDAQRLHQALIHAIAKQPKNIIILTHVPPFKETTRYLGQISSDDYLPFFGSKATGDVIQEIAKANPAINFLLLCGHTHDKCQYRAAKNLMVCAGQAEYYQPTLQAMIDTENLAGYFN